MGLIDTELGLKAVTPDGAFYTMLDVSRVWIVDEGCRGIA